MSTCLVSQLKGVVDNNSLPRFGYIHLKVKDLITAPFILKFASLGTNFHAYIEGNGAFVDSNGDNPVSEVTYSTFNSHSYLSIGTTYDLYIKKGTFGQMAFDSGSSADFYVNKGRIFGNIEEFSYCNIGLFLASNLHLEGDLDKTLKGNSNITQIDLSNNNFYTGTIKKLVELCPNVQRVMLQGNPPFSGSLKDFLDESNGYILKVPLTTLNVKYHSAIINEPITVGGVETTALQRLIDLGVSVTR